MSFLFRLFAILLFASSALVADDVMQAAQQKLETLGFYEGPIDGQYGSQTAAAIRRYQLDQKLRVTGSLNEQTRNSLRLPTTPAVPQHVAIAAIFKGGPYITAPTATQLATIQQAKKNLKLLGYFTGPINDNVDPTLTSALKAWQKSARFRQTGRFDEATLKGLNLMSN